MSVASDSGEVRRFTARVVFLETPEVVEQLHEMARQQGHSLAAEIRGAVRYWIRAWETTDDD